MSVANFFLEVVTLKKLIEVAMPTKPINRAAAREKSIRHGHPSTLHLWWARRPLATARAVLFASLVDDPSEHPDKFPTDEAVEAERQRLFDIIAKIVDWDNSGDEKLFAEALAEIKKSVGDDLPAVFDPFAGGGTIPLEAQRLGLKSCASDLNPVAVMINKAMIELPAQFKNRPPVNPKVDKKLFNNWHGAEGLADDIRYYGKLLKSKAFDEIGDLYPKIYSAEHKTDLTVIAWLWARTVPCSNPACGHRMPLVHSFKLSTKQNVFVMPIVDGDKIRFEIRHGEGEPAGTVNSKGARCLFCGTESKLAHVRAQAKAGNMSAQLMAVVAEGERGRVYLAPDEAHEKIANVDMPDDVPEENLPDKALGFRVQEYGITQWHQLFTNRQLTALTTFGDLIPEIQKQVLDDGGDKDYADAIAVYLSFLVDKLANLHNAFCRWRNDNECSTELFARQAISMVWGFAESNPFSSSVGSIDNTLEWICKSVKNLPVKNIGEAQRHSALEKFPFSNVLVSTDPPYYDNVGYADLSEFFYVWLRRSLAAKYPKLFARGTLDKVGELIADPYRHGGDKTAAKKFFEDGMFRALQNIYAAANEDFPVTIYYAFKQRESKDGASTGWETMLTAIIRAGFQIVGTWPMRTEMASRMRSHDSNALATSVVLVCRKRPPENDYMSKNDFVRALKAELPKKLDALKQANIAPLDMPQAAIGLGMEVYSRCARVADMQDTPLTVRDALKMINAEVNEYLNNQMRNLDAASQFCVTLFEQSAFNEIPFGDADTLARAKDISVADLNRIGAVISDKGDVRLRDRDEIKIIDKKRQLQSDWLKRLVDGKCAWLWLQALVNVFKAAGLTGSGELLSHFDGKLEAVKDAAYCAYNICAKHENDKDWNDEFSLYNDIVSEWSDILSKITEFRAKQAKDATKGQQSLFATEATT